MTSADILADAFGRIRESVHDVSDGLAVDDLIFRPGGEANSIAWLIWHLTRVQDDHVAGVAEADQVWMSSGWVQRFGLQLDDLDTGYGHTPLQVAAVVADSATLRGYHDAVYESTVRFVRTLRDKDLDRIVDERWEPPVTLGVRMVSVVTDDLQHVGQAAYVRGMLRHD